MPTYEYKREDGSTFEVNQGINDKALEECPETGQKVKRVITGGGGVVYKGEGFYITDYKRKEQKNGNGSPRDSNSGSDSNGSSKTESSTESSSGKDSK